MRRATRELERNRLGSQGVLKVLQNERSRWLNCVFPAKSTNRAAACGTADRVGRPLRMYVRSAKEMPP